MPNGTSTSLDFNKILNDSLRVFFKDALRSALSNPSQTVFFLKTLNWQKRAAKIRENWKRQGINVPPILIFSVTSKCNLHCKGCYHQTLHQTSETDITDERLNTAIKEAKELGISFIVLAGGEPLMRPNILEIPHEYPDIMFLMFTNGLLINDTILKKMKQKRNIVPLISLEGYQTDTDERRGKGVYQLIQKAITNLNNSGIFWGTSLTLTKNNFNEVIDEDFIKKLVNHGCKLFMLVEYTPLKPDTENWVITETQRQELITKRNLYRSKYPALFIALPWDEEEVGGCLSAGRGFIHISSEGNVEPCPFVSYSDTNIKNMPLKEALQSKLLRTIRENHNQLDKTHICALWKQEEWTKNLTPSEQSSPEEPPNHRQ